MLLYMDSFDTFNDNSGFFTYRWDGFGGSLSTSITRFGVGQSVELRNDASIYKSVPNMPDGIISFSAYLFGGLDYRAVLLIGYDGASVQFGVSLNSSRQIIVWRGTNSTILDTSTYVFPINRWVRVEIRFAVTNSLASTQFRIKCDMVTALDVATSSDTQSTGNGYITQAYFGGQNGVSPWSTGKLYVDDLVIQDLNGPTFDDFLGDVRISALTPSGNGNSSDLVNTASNSTNNYTYVDDANPDGDSTYVESAVDGDTDTYAFGDTPATAITILCVTPCIIAKKTDVGVIGIAAVVRMGGTDYPQTTSNLSSNYQLYQTFIETRPSDSGAWTKSDVDGAEFGIQVDA